MKQILFRISSSTCLLFSIFTFTINMIYWISNYGVRNIMLGIGAIFLFLLLSLIVCSVVVYFRSNKKVQFGFSKTLISYTAIIYTVVSIIVNVLHYIIKVQNFWDGFTLLIILGFSFVISLMILKLKLNNYFISVCLYFFVIGILYGLIFIWKAKFNQGKALFITLAVYIVMYLLATVPYFILQAMKKKKQNATKDYKNMFS